MNVRAPVMQKIIPRRIPATQAASQRIFDVLLIFSSLMALARVREKASKLSEKKGVALVCTGVFHEFKGIDELDLAILFGNLLDNAIEAVKPQENKIIEIKFSIYNDYCNILFSNPITDSVLKNNPSLSTTKSKSSKHGFGLKSVRSIVDKYSGIFDAYEEGSKFNIQISLPIV